MPVLVMMQSSSLCLWCFYIWSYGRQCPDDYFGHEVWKLQMIRQFLTRDLLLLTHWQETASEQLTPCIGIHVTCYLLQLASKCFCWIVSCVTEALRWKATLSWSSRQITQAGALFHVTHDSCAFHVTHDSCGNMIGIADQGIYNAFTSHVVIENRWCEVGRLSHK